jgi:hypothetical protein
MIQTGSWQMDDFIDEGGLLVGVLSRRDFKIAWNSAFE